MVICSLSEGYVYNFVQYIYSIYIHGGVGRGVVSLWYLENTRNYPLSVYEGKCQFLKKQ